MPRPRLKSEMCANAAMAATLTTKMDMSLLRGVRLDKALQCCGSHWSSNMGSEHHDPEQEYAMSQRVPHIDCFLTHDWQTGRWPKYFALCMEFNLRVATVCSVLVLLVPLVLGASPPLFLEHSPQVFTIAGEDIEVRSTVLLMPCLGTFWFLFFFWRSIQGCFLGGRLPFVFIDKFCIHQTNESLKKEGILSLAGFLENTNKFVVLWSSRYFSRLWCVYEVACWLHLDRDIEQTVSFLSVDAAVVFLVACGGLCLAQVAGQLLSYAVGFNPLWLSIIRSFALFGAIHLGRGFAIAVQAFPRQLDEFSIRDADCFCCRAGHVHPTTKATIPCDRRIIYATLVKWFGDPENGVDVCATSDMNSPEVQDALDLFDHHVRTKVQDLFRMKSENLIPVSIPYRIALILEISACFFWLDSIFAWRDKSGMAIFRMSLLVCAIFLFIFPCMFKLALTLVTTVTRLCGTDRSCIFNLLTSVGIVIAVVAAHEALVQQVNSSAAQRDPFRQMEVTAALGALTLWCYWGRVKRGCGFDRGRFLKTPSLRSTVVGDRMLEDLRGAAPVMSVAPTENFRAGS